MSDEMNQSPLGPIPNDWVCEDLESFTSFISYGFTNPMPTTQSGPYMVTAADVTDGRINYSTARRTSIEAFETKLTSKSKPRKNDVLLTKDGALGRVALVGDETICINQSVAILRPNKRIYPSFFNHLLQAELYQKKMLEDAGGSTIKHIYITIVNHMPIAVPENMDEQQAIAAALSDADGVVAGLERVIAKKRLIKQGAMQDLLTARRRLPGFSGEWEVKRLGAALTVRHGRSQKEVEHPAGEFPILATGGQIGTATKFLCDKPSVLIGRKGTIDVPRFMDKPFWSVDTLFYTDVHTGFDAKFLFYVFLLIDWMSYNEASGVPSLNAKTIENIEVSIPKLDEQQVIAAVLSDMDTEIQTLESRLTKARAVKEGMMQNLLTGRVRLV